MNLFNHTIVYTLNVKKQDIHVIMKCFKFLIKSPLIFRFYYFVLYDAFTAAQEIGF